LVDSDNQPLRTLTAAKEALEAKRHERRQRALPTLGHQPLFQDYVETYFAKANSKGIGLDCAKLCSPVYDINDFESRQQRAIDLEQILAHWPSF